MKKQSGFTLVELVVVIVILGILAAYAVPKYMNIDKEARIAVVKAFSNSVRSAAELVHGIAIARGKFDLSTVPPEGKYISMTTGLVVTEIPPTSNPAAVLIYSNGYPANHTEGIGAALSDTSGFATENCETNNTRCALQSVNATFEGGGSDNKLPAHSILFKKIGSPNSYNCSVLYINDASQNGIGMRIVAYTSGC